MRLELTRRGDYAVRAAIALARNDGSGLMSTRRIAAEMAIPPRFLPQVMADLVRAGVVLAHTGRAGGYRLARPSAEISLLAVIRAAERDTRTRSCILRGGPCDPAGHCDVHEAFIGARDAMLESLAGTSLATIVARPTLPAGANGLAAADDGSPI
jgi:Rrf2 family protein